MSHPIQNPFVRFDNVALPLAALYFLSSPHFVNAASNTQSRALVQSPVQVEGQPLAANVSRLLQALEFLGSPLPEPIQRDIVTLCKAQDATRLQQVLDPRVTFVAEIGRNSRIKLLNGAASPSLQQNGYTPVLIKVINEAGVSAPLRLTSPQAGPVYAGVAKLSMDRQRQQPLRENENVEGRKDRFLDIELFANHPMTSRLSGLLVEYVIALVYAGEAGKLESTLGASVGDEARARLSGTTTVRFDVRPAILVKLRVRDFDGSPTTGRFLFTDRAGHVYPPQPKRLAPDFFFQKHIYRADGEIVLLPPGEFTMYYGRGPEYKWLSKTIVIGSAGESKSKSKLGTTSRLPARPSVEMSQSVIPRNEGPAFNATSAAKRRRKADPSNLGMTTRAPRMRISSSAQIAVRLVRWVNPMSFGFYAGDHHIHAAGCAHYTSPTEGVNPADMFKQVKGEGLNVGCVLTWGPCFDSQKQYFEPSPKSLSEPLSILKYDIEVSGFGSQALGHICLLNLKEQIYPGADGSKNWPTWTVPILRWTKAQGGVTGYAHSGSGLQVNPAAAAKRLLADLDRNGDGHLDKSEAAAGLLPEAFAQTDANNDGVLGELELAASINRAADRLPNFAIPELDSVGAQEIFVSAPLGLCDFISAMDTARLLEWNCWYHLMNCGLPLKVSGETDFPCMSSTRVGQGRVYVQLGHVKNLDYQAWCAGIAKGHAYVSDWYAHALEFAVNGKTMGEEVRLAAPGTLHVKAKVAFSSQTPLEVAHGGAMPKGGMRLVGDTVDYHDVSEYPDTEHSPSGGRLVELVVNGRPVASKVVPADDREHNLEFEVKVDRSSWIALRHFPQLHTNPVTVLVADKPIRASKQSALWCLGCVDQLWRVRNQAISPREREDARKAYDQAREYYRKIAQEASVN